MSRGTRIRRSVISCSTPSASRSLAQKTAVGRSAGGSSAISAPACRPAATVSVGVTTVRTSTPPRSAAVKPFAAIGDLGDGHGPAGEGDALMTQLAQVLARDPSAENVVHRDRAPVPLARPAVHQHDRDAALDEARQLRVASTVDRRDEDALHPLLLEQVEVPPLPGRVSRRCCRPPRRRRQPRSPPRPRGPRR